MRKFLIMLMVVAMASFLMVGCLSGVTPDVDEDVDEDVAVTGVTLDKATLALTVGDAPVTLVATVAPADATDPRVIWASSDEAVAIVALGVVTPLNAGISAITATTVDGPFVATCVVTVTAADVPAPASTTPVIEKIINNPDDEDDLANVINLYSSDPQYMNKTEVENGILVKGFALKYSEVKVYVGGVVVGTSTTYGVLERFTVFVAKASLGDDGAKTLYATATEMGLAESAPSTVYAFTLDTVAPEVVSVVAVAEEELDPFGFPPVDPPVDGTVTVTFDEELDKTTAEDEGDWIVKNITQGVGVDISNAERILPKVIELEVAFSPGLVVEPFEGNFIRVDYKDDTPNDPTPITDLAGNPAVESFEYCWLELEE